MEFNEKIIFSLLNCSLESFKNFIEQIDIHIKESHKNYYRIEEQQLNEVFYKLERLTSIILQRKEDLQTNFEEQHILQIKYDIAQRKKNKISNRLFNIRLFKRFD